MKAVFIRARIVQLLVSIFIVGIAAATVSAGGFPHYLQNEIECESCHYVLGNEPKLLPPWTSHTPVNDDDTPFNSLCRSCHFEGGSAASVETHSSLQTDNGYGDWTVECITCHDPHFQVQSFTYTEPSDYLAQGTVSSLTPLTITRDPDPGWTPDAFADLLLIPNTAEIYTSYKIAGNTSNTITAETPMDTTMVKDAGGSPVTKTGSETVKFVRPVGKNSFADGDAAVDGICEVCHTIP